MIYTHPGQPEMQVEVILASVGQRGAPIYTVRTRHPRPLHAEWNTHRVFSRLGRSSRAVPIEKMIEEVLTRPYVPWRLGKNQRGMQAGADFTPEEAAAFRDVYLEARDNAVASAQHLSCLGAHKQLANRLLEPFMWIDCLTTSVEWGNFLALRDHDAAEPHFHDLAKLVRQAISEAPVQVLAPNAWHLPYNQPDDIQRVWAYLRPKAIPAPGEITEYLKKLSAARCARISYAPFDGNASIKAELDRYDALMKNAPRHASPVENQATPDPDFTSPQLHGNLPGWIQFRKTITGESIRG